MARGAPRSTPQRTGGLCPTNPLRAHRHVLRGMAHGRGGEHPRLPGAVVYGPGHDVIRRSLPSRWRVGGPEGLRGGVGRGDDTDLLRAQPRLRSSSAGERVRGARDVPGGAASGVPAQGGFQLQGRCLSELPCGHGVLRTAGGRRAGTGPRPGSHRPLRAPRSQLGLHAPRGDRRSPLIAGHPSAPAEGPLTAEEAHLS